MRQRPDDHGKWLVLDERDPWRASFPRDEHRSSGELGKIRALGNATVKTRMQCWRCRAGNEVGNPRRPARPSILPVIRQSRMARYRYCSLAEIR